MEKWTLVLFALFVGGRIATKSFEASAARDIQSRLTQPGVVEIRIKPTSLFSFLDGKLDKADFTGSHFETVGLPLLTETDYSTAGGIKSLHFRFQDVQLTGLRVASLEADIPDCRYDRTYAITKKRVRLTRSGIGWGRAEVTAESLAEFLSHKYQAMTGIRLELRNGAFVLTGSTTILRSVVAFRVTGRLEAKDGTKLVAVQCRLEMNGKPASQAATDDFLRKLNPVLDEDADLKLLDTIIIRKLTLENDRLIVEGDTKIPISKGDKP